MEDLFEKVKKKVRKMYRNYGINVSEITDDEFNRVSEYYFNNVKELEVDYKKSTKHQDLYADEEVV